MSDCTPKHPFVDLAPAFEEPPDLLSAPSILHSTVLCGVVRPNQPTVMVRWQAGAQIHGPAQTEPSPQGPLPKQRVNAIVHISRCFILSVRSCRAFRFVRQRTPVSEKFVAHVIVVAVPQSCTARYT